MYAALPHAEIGLLQVGDLDGAVAAVVVPVGLETVVLVSVPLALAEIAIRVSSLQDTFTLPEFFGSLSRNLAVIFCHVL